jgi:hypothetical protein
VEQFFLATNNWLRQLLLTVEQGSNQGATYGPSDLKAI